MGLMGKSKSGSEGWGMGFLLVFFPEDQDTIINKKETNLFSYSTSSTTSSSSSSSSPLLRPNTAINTLLKRTNSTHLHARAQSTISICVLLIFTALLLFTLSTIEPTSTIHFTARRQLSLIHNTNKNSPRWSMNWLKGSSNYKPVADSELIASGSHALQGMGTLYRRGTKAMGDLIVAHVSESVTVNELRLFLRLFHRSALTSRSDLLFIFPSKGISFADAIQEENDSLFKLVQQFKELNSTGVNSIVSFDPTQFLKWHKKEKEIAEPMWGRRIRNNIREGSDTESTRLSYGSVVGFEVDELDPENSLAGFLDHVPMSLRRWACYPMLLGRLRRNFKHVMLVDVKDMILLGDPLVRVRNRRPESVFLSIICQSRTSKQDRKNLEKTQSNRQKSVNPAFIMGGYRGVRRLSNAMLTEIARAAMQHKRRNSVSESGLFNQLVGNEFILKNVNLIRETESAPEVSSLVGLSLNSGSRLSLSGHPVVRRGNSNIDFNSIVMKHICSFPLDSSVYNDC